MYIAFPPSTYVVGTVRPVLSDHSKKDNKKKILKTNGSLK